MSRIGKLIDRQQICGCLGMVGMGRGGGWQTAKGFRVFFNSENVLKSTVNILTATESYTLNGYIVWYVNYISKLF